MNPLIVNLGERSYPVFIGARAMQYLSSALESVGSGQVFVVSNPTVAPLYLPAVKTMLGNRLHGTFLMPDGEQYKTLATYTEALNAVMESGLHRDGIILALGGGVVGDLAGFVAATFQRGVRFLQVPTTLLAQVDSSVGGKTAVNHALGKNMIGAFHQPNAVVIDTTTLETLPERELKAGLAEVIKYGVIEDANFFTWLEQNMPALLQRDPEALRYAIEVSCSIKARIVSADEREQGVRALLNYGHTFGHVIESYAGYGNWLHGEAVAAGMVIASHLASAMQWCDVSDYRRIKALVEAAGLPTSAPNMQWQDWQAGLYRDKKVQNGLVRFVLPTAIGCAAITEQPIAPELLQASVAHQ
ncbi:3-dehydroquinate synthase [Aliidiomarina celeris]|uniref:3-dehydroquinate synthase n=1 Tax=Aliidiomarina celeris TaxID=2249428 RepID=UPI000DEAB5BC|nr:3-dehydroquinate synthase [Aliidiomarina celeris]